MREPPERGVVVDATQFPLLLVWFGRRTSDADWKAALAEVDEFVRGDTPFVVLNVTRPDMETPTANQRRMVADWNAMYVAAGHDKIVGWGTVVQSHVLRGVLTAISWITTFPYEQKAVSNLDDGLAWAKQLLARKLGS